MSDNIAVKFFNSFNWLLRTTTTASFAVLGGIRIGEELKRANENLKGEKVNKKDLAASVGLICMDTVRTVIHAKRLKSALVDEPYHRRGWDQKERFDKKVGDEEAFESNQTTSTLHYTTLPTLGGLGASALAFFARREHGLSDPRNQRRIAAECAEFCVFARFPLNTRFIKEKLFSNNGIDFSKNLNWFVERNPAANFLLLVLNGAQIESWRKGSDQWSSLLEILKQPTPPNNTNTTQPQNSSESSNHGSSSSSSSSNSETPQLITTSDRINDILSKKNLSEKEIQDLRALILNFTQEAARDQAEIWSSIVSKQIDVNERKKKK